MDSTTFAANATVAEPRFRFSLRGLFVALTLCAIFFGVWNLENVRWTDACRMVATLLILGGLAAQIVDVRRAAKSRSHPQINSSAAWETGWRVALGTLLVVFLTETIWQQMFPVRFVTTELFFDKLKKVPEAGWLLGVLLVYLEARALQSKPRTWFRSLCSVLGLFAGCGLILYMIHDWSLIDYLVQTGIRSVELAQPTWRNGKPFSDFQLHAALQQQLRTGAWFTTAALAAVMVTGWFSLHCRQRAWRWTSGTLAVLGLLALVAVNLWAYQAIGLINRFRLPNPDLQTLYYPLNLFLVTALFVSGATAVFLRDFPREEHPVQRFLWRKPFGGYVHEWSLTFVLLLAVLPSIYIDNLTLNSGFGTLRFFGGPLRFKEKLGHLLYCLIQESPLLLATLLIVTIAGALFRLWWPSAQREHFGTKLTPLPWQRVLVIWPFLFAFLFTLLYTFHWLSWVIFMQIP